jgi:hypothetical protein
LLTLTADERDAFDWVGGRYHAGRVAALLLGCLTESDDWAGPDDITFRVPEHVAWEIGELRDDESGSWPCFADGLRAKLNEFCDRVV